ncbi:hypothetical protein ACROYT_G025160 [Oculina patagonica]
MSTKPVKSTHIVTFVDASQQAYGAAVNLRCEYHNDAVTSRLITAKSKVAPLTPMTVPRLELMGAIFGLRLTQSLLTVLQAPMQRVCTEPSQWQHVSTDENPADLCIRGATPSELAECSLWWNGPDWLTKDFSEWSKMQVPNRPTEMPKMKTSKRKEDTNASVTLVTYNLQKEAAPKQNNTRELWRLEPKRFSSWVRLAQVHARKGRVLHNMRNRDNRNANMELSPEEIKDAEEEIVRLTQREAFRDEYTALSSRKPIPKKSVDQA